MSTGTKIGVAALAIIFLLPGACGGLFFGAALVEWLNNGFGFRNGPDNYIAAVVVVAAPSLLLSVILLGVLLRYLHWSAARRASLALGIVATFTVLFSFAMLIGISDFRKAEDKVVLIVVCLAGFAVAALPPFIFWRRR